MSRSLSHQVGILMIGRLFTYVAMVFVPIVNTRALSVEEYGYYRQFHLLFETLTPLLILGFPLSLQYYLPRAETQREKSVYVTQTLAYLIVSGLLAFLIYLVLGEVLGGGLGLMIRSFFWRIAAFTGLMTVCDYMEWLFVAEKEVGRQSIYHATFTAIQAIVVMTVAWVYRDVSSMIWGLTIFAFVKFLFAIVYTYRRYHPSFRLLSMATIREQFTFALPVGLFAIILVLLNQTDKFIINRYMGRAGFAVYAVGAFQLPFVNMIAQSVRNVTFPLMAQSQKAGNYANVADVWKRGVLKSAIIYFPLFVFFEASAWSVIRVLFTNTYESATPIFMIYLILLLQVCTDTVAIVQVFKNTRYLLKTTTAALITNLVLSLMLYRWIGREGVPAGTVITIYAVNVVNMMYSSRLCGLPFSEFLPVRALVTRFIAAVAPGIPLWWVFRNLPTDNVWAIGGLALAYAAAYSGICGATGLITMNDIRALLGRKGATL